MLLLLYVLLLWNVGAMVGINVYKVEELNADPHFCKLFKDDFQSVLRTLESLFLFFVLLHVRYHKM